MLTNNVLKHSRNRQVQLTSSEEGAMMDKNELEQCSHQDTFWGKVRLCVFVSLCLCVFVSLCLYVSLSVCAVYAVFLPVSMCLSL